MSTWDNPGAMLAVIGNYHGILDNWKKRTAATVKEFLTVRFAGPRKTRKDMGGETLFSEILAFRGQKREAR